MHPRQASGLTAEITYFSVLVYQRGTRRTIAKTQFISMYYVYNFGEKANAAIRHGLLGK